LDDFEAAKGFRWTNGTAAVPTPMFASLIGPLTIVLHVGATSRYQDEGNGLRVA